MAAGQYDFCAEANTYLHYRLQLVEEVKDADGKPVEQPIDLTGLTPLMHVRKSSCDPDPPVLVFSVADGGVIARANEVDDGVFWLKKTTAQMAAVEPGTYVYDLILMQGTEVQRIIGGAFVVTPVITDPNTTSPTPAAGPTKGDTRHDRMHH